MYYYERKERNIFVFLSFCFSLLGDYISNMKKDKLREKAKEEGVKTLRSIRMSKGMTQQDVANLTRGTDYYIPQGTLSGWELGINVPSANDLLILAGIYKVSNASVIEGWKNTIVEKK